MKTCYELNNRPSHPNPPGRNGPCETKTRATWVQTFTLPPNKLQSPSATPFGPLWQYYSLCWNNTYSNFWYGKSLSIIILQGISHWTGLYELALTDRNMQVKSCLKVVLECWDNKFLIYILGFQKSNIGWPQQPLTERV